MPKVSSRKTVLIIDDDRDIQLFLSSVIANRGFRAICAENRADAWSLAASEHPDCIVLNCLMCGEEGIDLYRRLKSDDELKQIPVVMLSAVGKEIMLQHWMLRSQGAAGAIPEPEAFVISPPDGDAVAGWVHALTRI